MIIEIKNLPSGQRIHKLSVDVTFTESGDPIVDAKIELPSKQDESSRPVIHSITTKKKKDDKRPPISVPSEMLENEF